MDKHREISIQEAVYRMLSFPMTKSSVVVKYLSTVHPHLRDGLLKTDLKDLEEGEEIFHNSPHTYYENRPYILFKSEDNDYNDEAYGVDYWTTLPISKFWSKYDVVYASKTKYNVKKLIPLLNGKGYIRERKKDAVLRYYLNYENTEDFCRGLLTLFYPFRDEILDIHQEDVGKLVLDNWESIQENRRSFEAHKVMTDMINDVLKLYETTNMEGDKDIDDEEENQMNENEFNLETTSKEDIADFDKWARQQASKNLDNVKQYMTLTNKLSFRKLISGLNEQQRKIFDPILCVF